MASTVLIVAIPALLVVALLLINMLGDGLLKRSQTSTAADASALAAAEQWRSYVDSALTDADGTSGTRALDLLEQLLTTDPAALDATQVQRRARELAQANGANLIGFDTRLTHRGVEFRVRTRSVATANETSIHLEASATSLVELDDGVCITGLRLGLVLDHECTAWSKLKDDLDPPTSDPPTDPDDPDDSTPSTPAPLSLQSLRTDVRLVA